MPLNFLKQLRQSRRLTLKELSQQTGVTAQSLSRYELGQMNLSKHTIIKVLRALDATHEELENGPDFFDQKLLTKNMILIDKHYPNLDREYIVRIAIEMYKFSRRLKILEKDRLDDFTKELEEQFIKGSAARSFLMENDLSKNNSIKNDSSEEKN